MIKQIDQSQCTNIGHSELKHLECAEKENRSTIKQVKQGRAQQLIKETFKSGEVKH